MRERDLASLLREVRRLCPETPVLEAEPMSRHCSFRIGGPCDAMLLPGSPEELERICRLLAQGGERPFLMGNGTNLLITDGPFRRIVIRLGERFAALTPGNGDFLEAQAGSFFLSWPPRPPVGDCRDWNSPTGSPARWGARCA